MKLADYQGFSQTDGAAAMNVSRSSFGRMIRGSHRKIADAIINGKIIKIVLGDAQVGVRKTEFTKENLKEEIARFRTKEYRQGSLSQAARTS